jgi:hypothetical protein
VKVGEMFPDNYLKGPAIVGQPVLALIVSVISVKLRSGPDKPEEPAFVLFFENISPKTDKPQRIPTLAYKPGFGHQLVLRRELADEIARAIGAGDTDEWGGKRVVLFAGESKRVSGRTVTPLHARAPKAAPAAQPQTTTPEHQPQAEGTPA